MNCFATHLCVAIFALLLGTAVSFAEGPPSEARSEVSIVNADYVQWESTIAIKINSAIATKDNDALFEDLKEVSNYRILHDSRLKGHSRSEINHATDDVALLLKKLVEQSQDPGIRSAALNASMAFFRANTNKYRSTGHMQGHLENVANRTLTEFYKDTKLPDDIRKAARSEAKVIRRSRPLSATATANISSTGMGLSEAVNIYTSIPSGQLPLGKGDTAYDAQHPAARHRVLTAHAAEMEEHAKSGSLVAHRVEKETGSKKLVGSKKETKFMKVDGESLEDVELDFKKMSPSMRKKIIDNSVELGTLSREDAAAIRAGLKAFQIVRYIGKGLGILSLGITAFDVARTAYRAKKSGETNIEVLGAATCKFIDDMTFSIYCSSVKLLTNSPQIMHDAMINMSKQKDFDGSLLWDMATRDEREKAQRRRDLSVQSCVETYQYDKKGYPTLEDVKNACEFYRSHDAPEDYSSGEIPSTSGAAH